MNPLHRPKLCARLAATALILAAAWTLLVPVTAVYVTTFTDPKPREVTRLYSWWTHDQRIVYSDGSGLDLPKLTPAEFQQRPLASGFRLDCGNAFGAGPHEQLQRPQGPQVCAGVRSPRRTTGLSLLAAGLIGVFASIKLPTESEWHRNRYRQPLTQRLALWRSR
jgi:hypothetical protein